MAFGQPPPALIAQQFTVKELGRRQPERAIKQELPRRAREQIRAANDFRDSHRRIIHHASQLISRNIIMPPHDKIPKILPGHKFLFAEIFIMKRNHSTVGNAEAKGR